MALSIKDRKELREKLLLDLYEYYFKNNGSSYRTSREEIRTVEEAELAYQYLQDKGLITVERQGNQFFVFSITAYGIDRAEELTPINKKVSDSDESKTPYALQDNPAKGYMEW